MSEALPRKRFDWANLLVWLLIAAYVGLFGWLSITRYRAFATNAYDLGNVNQALWNTVHGRPLYFTNWRGVELNLATDSRLAMHVEPIYLLLAVIYAIWQRPETILAIQTVGLGLGALPIFWLARERLGNSASGLAFAAVYLLFPGLEAANLWEFHAVALAAPLLLFAFYFGQHGRWGLMWLFAVLAMGTKEEIPLTVFVLGLYLALWGLVNARREAIGRHKHGFSLRDALYKPQASHGLALALVAAVWFVVAVFVVIPHFEGSGSPYLAYYENMSQEARGPVEGMLPAPGAVFGALAGRRNLRYLIDLYTPVAFLSLFSPLTAIFSLPDLLINLLSTHEPMHFVEKYHYTAPLLPGVLISAILGASWLARVLSARLRVTARTIALILTVVILAATGFYHYYHGYTPLARAFEPYRVTDHHRLGDEIAALIPTDAAVSAQPNLNPQVSGRKTLYRFPYVGDAEYVFLDVSTLANKGQQYELIEGLLGGGMFGIVRAEDGYLLLRRGEAESNDLPDGFYDFARANPGSDPVPAYAVDITFGDVVRLVGFDLFDGRHTEMPQTPLRFFLYWEAIRPLSEEYRFALYLLDANRQVIGSMDLARKPGVQYWYPTSRWAPGETIKMEISDLPWWTAQYARYSVALGVQRGRDPWDVSARLRPRVNSGSLQLPYADNRTLVELMAFRSDLGGMPARIEQWTMSQLPSGATQQEASWENGVQLLGHRIDDLTPNPGETLDVTIYWSTTRPIPSDLKVFVHMIGDGQLLTQHDAVPHLGGFPTSEWRPGDVIQDRHPLALPSDLPPGIYTLFVGMYDPVTGERVPLRDGGDAVTLAEVIEIR